MKATTKTKKRQQQQQAKTRPSGLANRLLSSPRDKHSARKLCESETSYGPGLVSKSEGVFCDMGTKTQWPLCEEDGRELKECYRYGTHSLVSGGEHVPRNYASVEEWEYVGKEKR